MDSRPTRCPARPCFLNVQRSQFVSPLNRPPMSILQRLPSGPTGSGRPVAESVLRVEPGRGRAHWVASISSARPERNGVELSPQSLVLFSLSWQTDYQGTGSTDRIPGWLPGTQAVVKATLKVGLLPTTCHGRRLMYWKVGDRPDAPGASTRDDEPATGPARVSGTVWRVLDSGQVVLRAGQTFRDGVTGKSAQVNEKRRRQPGDQDGIGRASERVEV